MLIKNDPQKLNISRALKLFTKKEDVLKIKIPPPSKRDKTSLGRVNRQTLLLTPKCYMPKSIIHDVRDTTTKLTLHNNDHIISITKAADTAITEAREQGVHNTAPQNGRQNSPLWTASRGMNGTATIQNRCPHIPEG
jgi:hypothetical protein